MDLASLFTRAAWHGALFRQRLNERPHRPSRNYSESVAAFSEELPVHGMTAPKVVDALARLAEPGLHSMAGSRFHGWVIGGSHPVGVAADIMTSIWGQNAGNHMATPSAAAAELIAGRWLLEMLRLPAESSVGFVTGATMANFTCLAAARSAVLKKVGYDVDREGLFGATPINVVMGDDAHTTVFSALQYLGLGHDRVFRVRTDQQGRILPAEFKTLIEGLQGPYIAILQAGQINTGAFDDFASLIPLAKASGAWVHVDGAFGLWAQTVPSLRHLSRGVELADSWATDGHKWLQTPYDCGYAIVRDEAVHRRAMTIAASYLPTASDDERDPSHYVPELSRRARGFATWAMVKHLGHEGIAELVTRNCDAARHIAEWLATEGGIEIMNDVCLNQVVVRFGADRSPEEGDRLTEATIEALQRGGEAFAGGAKWRKRQVMRISVSNYQTDRKEAERTAEAILVAYRNAKGANSEIAFTTSSRDGASRE